MVPVDVEARRFQFIMRVFLVEVWNQVGSRLRDHIRSQIEAEISISPWVRNQVKWAKISDTY